MIRLKHRKHAVKAGWLLKRGVGRKYLDSSISHPSIKDLEYTRIISHFGDEIQAMSRKGKGLILYGPHGTGKTSLSVYLAKEILSREGSFWFIEAHDIPRAVIENETPDGMSHRVVHIMETVDYLIIDNLNEELAGKWSSEALEHLVRKRYSNLKGMIISTNVDPSKLNRIVNAGCFSILREVCLPVPVEGVDWRPPFDEEEIPGKIVRVGKKR